MGTVVIYSVRVERISGYIRAKRMRSLRTLVQKWKATLDPAKRVPRLAKIREYIEKYGLDGADLPQYDELKVVRLA
jgi:hypothetical protein